MGKNNNIKEEIIIKENGEEKEAALKKVFDEMDRKFGKGTLMKLGKKDSIDIKAISSGSIKLNEAIGVGGYPRGRIVEIFGPESSGKTTLALHAIAEAQKEGGSSAFIDAEHVLDPVYARDLGINTDELLVAQPDNGEQALEIAEALVRSGAIDVIVIDSVAALVPRAEIDGEMGDSHMGLQARLMSQGLRKLAGYISKHDCTVIFINQLREKVGIMFGNPETTPGGMALKFYASVRLDVRKIDTLKNGDEFYGNRIKVKVVKNKVAPPFKTVELTLLYGKGIDKDREVLDLGLEKGAIIKSGSWYSLSDGEIIGQGVDNAVKYFIENPDGRAKVIDEIVKSKE